MAEYYLLLERAVAGLQDASPASRRAIYDRARNALLGQLRAMQPPVPDADIERESVALDEAIERLEERIGKDRPRPAQNRVGPGGPEGRAESPAMPPGLPVGKAPPVPPPSGRGRSVPAPRPSPNAPAPRPAASPRPPGPSAAVSTESAVARPPPSGRTAGLGVRSESAAGSDSRVAAPTTPAFPGPAPVQPNDPARVVPDQPPPIDDPGSRPGAAIAAAPAAASPPEVSPVLPVAPTLEVPPPRGANAAPDQTNESGVANPVPSRTGPKVRDRSRPAAPRPNAVEPRSVGVYVVACVAFLLVVGIAVAAWKLRDRPEQVTAHAENSAPDTPNKIVDRVTGDGASTPTDVPGSSGEVRAVPAPLPQSTEAAPATASQPAPAAAATAEPAASAPAIPVSQRAALLVDAPEEPQKIKTYVGSVVWRNDSVSPGQDQPLSTAVRGDIDIPDAKLTMSMVLKKNLEAQFPASHTIEFHFAEVPGNTLGPVKQIGVPEMRKDDSASVGDPLTGVPVSITDDYFLVGLSRGGAESPNLQMMTNRNWIDVAIVFKSGKVGKITFEKGTAGQQILEDALKSWQ